MRDVSQARQHLEVFLLGEAIEHGGTTWKENIVSAFQLLKQRAAIRRQAEATDWEQAHQGFHFALIDQSGCRLLAEFHKTTWDHAYRYRLLTHLPEQTGALMEEHERLLEASLAPEKDLACALLRRHIRVWTERAAWTPEATTP